MGLFKWLKAILLCIGLFTLGIVSSVGSFFIMLFAFFIVVGAVIIACIIDPKE